MVERRRMLGRKQSKGHLGNNNVAGALPYSLRIVMVVMVAIVVFRDLPDVYMVSKIGLYQPTESRCTSRISLSQLVVKTTDQNEIRDDSHVMELTESVELPPELTVIIPLYDSLTYLDRLMENLGNQTYRNLKLIFSIEPTEQAEETDRKLRRYEQEIDLHNNPRTHIRNITIYNHSNRLHYFQNMNFLLHKVESDLYSYMQCDDLLPSNYYEELAKCLDDHPNAVNCYPEKILYGKTESELFDLLKNGKKDSIDKVETNEKRRHSYVDVFQHERVANAALGEGCPANRGVVRRPKYGPGFTYPRLYKNFFATDKAAMIHQAIAGDIVAVDLEYYKMWREESLSVSFLYDNVTRESMESLAFGWSDFAVQNYNNGHAFTTSSKDFSIQLNNFLSNKIEGLLKMMKRKLGQKFSVRDLIKKSKSSYFERIAQRKRVAILGAGIQGSLMALMFRKHGYDVTLIDKSNDIMDRTSSTGEGRIHMGLEYANDPSMETAKFMLESSMRFSSYLEYLVDKNLDWSQLKSERLTCLLPHTSHVSPLQFEEYGARLNEFYENILAKDASLSYLGERPPKILIGKTEVPRAVNSSYINAAYESIEVCVLSNKLKEVIREALYEKEVDLVFERTIVDVRRIDTEDGLGRFELFSHSNVGHQFVNRFDAVVNCLWERRAEFDRKMGLDHRSSKESYRVKANVRLENIPSLHGEIPSVSIMNGPFGDFVRYGPDDKVYFAWHPMSPTIITHNVSDVINQFDDHAASSFPPGYEDHIIQGHKKAFEMLFPAYDSRFLNEGIVGTGYVVANGLIDIDDPASGLHERRDPPNLIVDGYVSVKTQKLTNAPYNAFLLEKELFKKDSLTNKD